MMTPLFSPKPANICVNKYFLMFAQTEKVTAKKIINFGKKTTNLHSND
jgi:hypothetical protein